MKGRHHVLVAVLAMLAIGESIAGACQGAEQPYFSCKLKDASAFLCGTPSESGRPIKLQYRFIRDGKAELKYPATQGEQGSFVMSSRFFAHGSEIRVGFSVETYKYLLYELWDSKTGTVGGVYVLRNGKAMHHLRCEEYSADGLLPFEHRDLLPREKYRVLPW